MRTVALSLDLVSLVLSELSGALVVLRLELVLILVLLLQKLGLEPQNVRSRYRRIGECVGGQLMLRNYDLLR